MNRLVAGALAGPLVLQAISGIAAQSGPLSAAQHPGACKPSPTVLHAAVAPVAGLTLKQIQNATAIINAGAQLHVPERGQTIAVMTALEASSLTNPPAGQAQGTGPLGLFGRVADQKSLATPSDPTTSALDFYRALVRVRGWQNMPPTLAAHAAQRNLDPDAYTQWWPRAVTVVNALTTGTGAAGLRNLAARAQAVADCTAATVRGRFAVNGATRYVGPFAPTVLDSRALGFAQHGGNGWFDRCQAFVAILDGRPYSGYSTALDAWQTFEAEGVAHLVTSAEGVAPPVGAWLYYRDSTNPAGHVVTYLGDGQIASTDVFGQGRVGIGPASAITDGPWHMQYLGWAAPWGNQ
jgi:hypothetical protein